MSLPQFFACLLIGALGSAILDTPGTAAQSRASSPIVIIVHGGAGAMSPDTMDETARARYTETLGVALDSGYAVLSRGGASLDAVTTAIQLLEESPLFNAGRGAVLTSEGTAELDASIMDGASRNAGAVAGVKRVRSPIDLARRVMEVSPHVLLVGEGAETFAREQGITLVPNDYFITPERRRAYEESLNRSAIPEADDSPRFDASGDEKFGTVGAVALDVHGNLAAGTSTGGMAGKRFGRVGDSPIIGAGTYADNETCAVSATGHGEFFIRGAIAHDIAARMQYGGATLEEAARGAIHERLTGMGGTGGVIALDRSGNIAMPFNTSGMFRGFIDREGRREVSIFAE